MPGPEPKPERPTLADPQAVAAVREATSKTIRALRRSSTRAGRASARALRVAAAWAWPRLVRLALVCARGLARGLAASARWCWAQRRPLARVGHRALWWVGLALLVLAGRALLGEGEGSFEALVLDSLLIWFALGLGMAIVVLLSAPERRMRLAALALASGHGVLGLLAWSVGA